MFTWGWVPFVDPDPSCATSPTTRRPPTRRWSATTTPTGATTSTTQLYAQQHVELDPAKRRDIVQKMLQIFYDDAPYAVLYKYDELQAIRSDRWENFVRQPAETGPVLFTNTSPAYLELRPERRRRRRWRRVGLVVGGVAAGQPSPSPVAACGFVRDAGEATTSASSK